MINFQTTAKSFHYKCFLSACFDVSSRVHYISYFYQSPVSYAFTWFRLCQFVVSIHSFTRGASLTATSELSFSANSLYTVYCRHSPVCRYRLCVSCVCVSLSLLTTVRPIDEDLGHPIPECLDDGGGGDNWGYKTKTCKAPVKSTPPTPSILRPVRAPRL